MQVAMYNFLACPHLIMLQKLDRHIHFLFPSMLSSFEAFKSLQSSSWQSVRIDILYSRNILILLPEIWRIGNDKRIESSDWTLSWSSRMQEEQVWKATERKQVSIFLE